MPVRVKTGLDRIEKAWPKPLEHARVGLLVHPASINSGLRHASEVFHHANKLTLTALFGPQHGIRGETQDNMIEWEGFLDERTGVPVYSLYGETREPRDSMLSGIDVLAVDLQDVGARYYTFIWTLSLSMKACERKGIPVVVLDRPNPLGGEITEGPVLRENFRSFVGLQPLPVRHGMTVGEIARYLQAQFYPGTELYVVEMKGWRRTMWFEQTGLPWVLPSPNMPTNDTAFVYPGMCLLEATNLSEGRGTTRPFEIFGAPFIRPDELVKKLSEYRLAGVVFRPMYFMPTFHKFAGTLCGGAQIHVTDRESFKPFLAAVCILSAVHQLWPGYFSWKQPPYEYEEKLLPIDILAGTDRVRQEIEASVNPLQSEAWWDSERSDFEVLRTSAFLY